MPDSTKAFLKLLSAVSLARAARREPVSPRSPTMTTPATQNRDGLAEGRPDFARRCEARSDPAVPGQRRVAAQWRPWQGEQRRPSRSRTPPRNPSLTAVSAYIAIATGSSAVHNDIPSNTYHNVAATIGTGRERFCRPRIGGYQLSPLGAFAGSDR